MNSRRSPLRNKALTEQKAQLTRERLAGQLQSAAIAVAELSYEDFLSLQEEFQELTSLLERIEYGRPSRSMHDFRSVLDTLKAENAHLRQAVTRKKQSHRALHCSACDHLLNRGFSTKYCVVHGGSSLNSA